MNQCQSHRSRASLRIMPFPPHSVPEFPLCSDKRTSLFGGQPTGCSLPVKDDSASRYNILDRKPITVQSTRGQPNLRPWETSYGVDFKWGLQKCSLMGLVGFCQQKPKFKDQFSISFSTYNKLQVLMQI